MPAGNVTMTANAEANKYTIHFDPNGGFGHIDDIEATYDTDVTLPDVWNADGTAAYVKYTLDGQNVTEDVISGAIPKAMMAGYEEEETEIEDTETKDDENSDIEDEDTGKDGNDADIVETDTPDDMGEAEATETEDDSDDAKGICSHFYGRGFGRWQRYLYPEVESRRYRSEPCSRRWWRDHTLCCMG